MNRFDIDFLLKATGGRLIRGKENLQIANFCIDSRTAKEGSLFIPIIGEKTDAHSFIPSVYEAGCRLVLSQREEIEVPEGMSCILVSDTKKALQDIASLHRERIRIPLIGLSGSVGKTTTKEMAALALSAGKKVFKTPANQNSQIGVPLTLLSIDEEAQIGVIEMGISEPGEMSKIAALVRPDSALITNIGSAHIMLLGSREGIRDEKFHIMDRMKAGSCIFLNADDEILRSSSVYEGMRAIYFGRKKDGGAEAFATDISSEEGLYSFNAHVFGRSARVKLGVYGLHQVNNALASLALASHYGVDLEEAAKKIESFTGFKHRQQILKRNGMLIIDDTYNASPESMRAALAILKNTQSKRKIAVLADMKELGEREEAIHREIGREIARSGLADVVITYGDLAKKIGEECDRHYHFDSLEELQGFIESFAGEKDALLYKGSNSMRLYQIVDLLYAK